MRGPAGIGKSTIIQTCAEKLKKTGHLGAVFFFSVKKYDNSLILFTSIAYQLATTLPDYRTSIDERISKDKTLVEKKIPSQFRSLIVEPLQEIQKQGKRIQPKAIFIDGLDKCTSGNAQAEIIKIIVFSISEESTQFHWAIFSRAKPHIVSIFKQDNIAFITYSVELPISRKANSEIEMYLWEGFKNIIEQLDFLQFMLSWSTDDDIKSLVDAAAGLFAHPAAVLCYVAYPQDSQFHNRLQSVLEILFNTGKQVSTLPFLQLNAFYVHIMKQIPESILLAAQFLLFFPEHSWNAATCQQHVSMHCCMFRISKCMFRDIYHCLHAMISYEVSSDPFSSIDPHINLMQLYHDQGQWFHLDKSITYHALGIHETIYFYHKSFYDFLCDPFCSGVFCITTLTIYYKFLDHLIQGHHHYASSYAIDSSSIYFLPLCLP